MTTLEQPAVNNPLSQSNPFQNTPQFVCTRCGGLLVKTFCITPQEGTAEFQFSALKCLQCGDLFDAIIMENRLRSQHHQLSTKYEGRTL